MTVERALRKVERTARETVEWPEPPKWPEKCRVSAHFAYRPSEHQVDALEELEAALAADPRFEHMKPRAIKEAVEQFANAAFSNRSASHISGFIAANAEEPSDHICFFPVEGLTVHRRVQLGGATLTRAARSRPRAARRDRDHAPATKAHTGRHHRADPPASPQEYDRAPGGGGHDPLALREDRASATRTRSG